MKARTGGKHCSEGNSGGQSTGAVPSARESCWDPQLLGPLGFTPGLALALRVGVALATGFPQNSALPGCALSCSLSWGEKSHTLEAPLFLLNAQLLSSQGGRTSLWFRARLPQQHFLAVVKWLRVWALETLT